MQVPGWFYSVHCTPEICQPAFSIPRHSGHQQFEAFLVRSVWSGQQDKSRIECYILRFDCYVMHLIYFPYVTWLSSWSRPMTDLIVPAGKCNPACWTVMVLVPLPVVTWRRAMDEYAYRFIYCSIHVDNGSNRYCLLLSHTTSRMNGGKASQTFLACSLSEACGGTADSGLPCAAPSAASVRDPIVLWTLSFFRHSATIILLWHLFVCLKLSFVAILCLPGLDVVPRASIGLLFLTLVVLSVVGCPLPISIQHMRICGHFIM